MAAAKAKLVVVFFHPIVRQQATTYLPFAMHNPKARVHCHRARGAFQGQSPGKKARPFQVAVDGPPQCARQESFPCATLHTGQCFKNNSDSGDECGPSLELLKSILGVALVLVLPSQGQ